jgi:hypothetical protein
MDVGEFAHVMRSLFKGCRWPVNKHYGAGVLMRTAMDPERRSNLRRIGNSSQIRN